MCWRDAKTDPPHAGRNVVFVAGFPNPHDQLCFGYKDNNDNDSNQWWNLAESDPCDGRDIYTVRKWFDLPAVDL